MHCGRKGRVSHDVQAASIVNVKKTTLKKTEKNLKYIFEEVVWI
jgi:hypothetical protein